MGVGAVDEEGGSKGNERSSVARRGLTGRMPLVREGTRQGKARGESSDLTSDGSHAPIARPLHLRQKPELSLNPLQ